MGSSSGLKTHPNRILEPGEGINQFNFLSVCNLGGFSIGIVLMYGTTLIRQFNSRIRSSFSILFCMICSVIRQRPKTCYSRILSDLLCQIGGTPTQAVIVYQVPDTIMHFPVNYGDNWTSETRYGLYLNPAGQ